MMNVTKCLAMYRRAQLFTHLHYLVSIEKRLELVEHIKLKKLFFTYFLFQTEANQQLVSKNLFDFD